LKILRELILERLDIIVRVFFTIYFFEITFFFKYHFNITIDNTVTVTS